MEVDTGVLVGILVVLGIIAVLIGIYLYKWSESRHIVMPYRLYEQALVDGDENGVVFRKASVGVH